VIPIRRSENPRKQGDAGLGVAIAWYATNGYTVCVPLTDSQRFDLVIGKETLERVQVKTTTSIVHGRYSVSLRTKGGNRSGTGKTAYFDPAEVDVLFVVTGDGSCYAIPATSVRGKAVIELGRSYQQYRVHTPDTGPCQIAASLADS
jgi:hypothetical protein